MTALQRRIDDDGTDINGRQVEDDADKNDDDRPWNGKGLLDEPTTARQDIAKCRTRKRRHDWWPSMLRAGSGNKTGRR
jgi:hypothetical protein